MTKGEAGSSVPRVAWAVLSIVAAAGTVLFSLAWHDRYWRWRDCFNELGRCYDPERQEVFLEQAGLIWGTFAAGCLLALAVCLRRLAGRRRAFGVGVRSSRAPCPRSRR